MRSDELQLLKNALSTLAARGLTMLIIEHNLGFLSQVAERITMLDQGRVVVTDSPARVSRHPEVRRAYLGGYTA